MRRALVIGSDTASDVAVIYRLLAAQYEVVALSRQQPGICDKPIHDACRQPVVHPNLRWHCFDVSDDRYYHGIENALQGVKADVLVYLGDPEYFVAVRDATDPLWAYACVGGAEVSMMLKGIDALVQLGASNSGSGAHV